MGVDRIQSVRKAITPPFSQMGSECPVAVLKDEAEALLAALRRLYAAKGRVGNALSDSEALTDDAQHIALVCQKDDIRQMIDAVESRLETVEISASQLRAKSAEGAMFQLNLLYSYATDFPVDGGEATEEKADLIDRLPGLVFSIRNWVMDTQGLKPDVHIEERYLGDNDPHMTFERAMNFVSAED